MRTQGARDRRPRRARADIGKRRKRYAGKRVKSKRRIKFERRKGNKTRIKLRWMEEQDMSLEGYRRWHRDVRAKIRKKIYRWGAVVVTPVSDITTKKDIEDWALAAIGFEGKFIVLGISHCQRARTKRKWVKMFSVVIFNSPDGLRAKLQRNFRLFRYRWFWKGGR